MLVTGVEGLYVWCRRITGGYRGVEVSNMTEAWRSGLAFCAIIHRFRPDLIDYDSLDDQDPVGNCSLAFGVAEQHLDIPALLDPRDMGDCPVIDKLSVLTYLAQFYHKFSGSGPQPAARGSRTVTTSSSRVSSVSPASSSPAREAATSSSSSVSTDSGLDQSSSELSSCSRVSSVSPVPVPLASPQPEQELPVIHFRGILKSNDSKLATRKKYSRSFESLLDLPSPPTRRLESVSSKLRNDPATESSFKVAFKKFSTLSCSSSSIKTSPSTSPPKPARTHLVAARSVSSSGLRTISREVQTEAPHVPVLVSQVTQTEESSLEPGEDKRRRHRRQHSTTVPRGHLTTARVPNCDRSRQNRLVAGIASYGQLDKLLGRSVESLYSGSPPPPRLRVGSVPQFARTHSTLV